MTNKEAIEILQLAIAEVEWEYPIEYAVAFDKAIEALEKRIPKKPLGTQEDIDWGCAECPNCKTAFCSEGWQREYCCKCGQRILWRDEE